MSWRMIAIAHMLAFSISVSGTVVADKFVIGYLSTVNEQAERSTIGAFEQRLKSQGIEYELTKIDLTADRHRSDTRLLLTLGQGAAQTAVDQYANTPILSLFVRKETCTKLNSRRKGGADFSCIHLEQPADRLAYFTSRLFPGKFEALFIFGEKTGYAKASLKHAFEQEKIALRWEDAAIVQDLRKLRLKLPRSGVLVTSPDPTVYSPTSLQGVILNAYQAGVPILGFSDAFRRAGAAASLFTTAEQFGDQAAAWVISWKGGRNRGSEILTPENFEISVNNTVMRAMSLTTPDLDRLKAAYHQKKRSG